MNIRIEDREVRLMTANDYYSFKFWYLNNHKAELNNWNFFQNGEFISAVVQLQYNGLIEKKIPIKVINVGKYKKYTYNDITMTRDNTVTISFIIEKYCNYQK